MTETLDFREDAEAAIRDWLRGRAEARGKRAPDRIQRAFADTSPSGMVSYYVYKAAGVAGERAYLTADSTVYRGGFQVSYGKRPSYFPKHRLEKWETR